MNKRCRVAEEHRIPSILTCLLKTISKALLALYRAIVLFINVERYTVHLPT